MSNKAIFMICLIAVMAPVYVMFAVATANIMKDNRVKKDNTWRSKGMCYGMTCGILIGVVVGFGIWHTGSAMCIGIFAVDFIGALIGGVIGTVKDKAEKKDNVEI
ncbi:hypothetical protein [Butyrivibrio sp. WCE2006]|uniref:hypothetical protein n=1 Tax=Butyrivibrio sp. WCE2006 TaxID=1410611 RepID=UPI0005D17CA3|nr:hypothetical protein [Butyrivibrio sp. WCE2006]